MDGLKSLLELGRHIATEQDALLAQDDLSVERQLLLERAQSRAARRDQRRRFQQRLALVGAGVLAAAALVLLVLDFETGTNDQHLQVRVGGELVAPEALDNWWSAPPDKSLPIEFSDGTTIGLAPKSRARVLEVGQQGAHIVLESGASKIHVIPRESSHWQVSAGPFLVQVVGTSFDVEWGPDDDLFVLKLHKGKVNLSGCVFGEGRSVVAGETVRASCKSRHYEIATLAAEQAHLEETRAEPSATPPTSATNAVDETPQAPDSGSVRPPSWQQLARDGKFKQAVDAASAQGFDDALASASAGDLSLLGDAARFSGKPDLAIAAYEKLRSRYPGTARAATAAYSLARTHFDQRRAFGQAAHWFQQYLQEQPAGPLAREARGRLMESLNNSGDKAGARRMAETYLRRYPDGPHAALAKSLTRQR